MPYSYPKAAKPDDGADLDKGYCLVENVPDCPAAEAAGIGDRDHMRWQYDDYLDMNEDGGESMVESQGEDPATEDSQDALHDSAK